MSHAALQSRKQFPNPRGDAPSTVDRLNETQYAFWRRKLSASRTRRQVRASPCLGRERARGHFMQWHKYHLVRDLGALLILGPASTLISCSSEHEPSVTTARIQPPAETINAQSASPRVSATPPNFGNGGVLAHAGGGCETPTTGRFDYLAGGLVPTAPVGGDCASTSTDTANLHVVTLKATFSANVRDQVAAAVSQYKEAHP